MVDSPSVPVGLDWLAQQGLSTEQVRSLNPCLPGEFTMQDTYYVNGATPGMVYRGSEEGTLPIVPGRWYLIPTDIVRDFPRLAADTCAVSRAVRLTR